MPRLAQPAPQVAGAPAPISPETAIPPPEKPAPALTEPTATTSMRASCAWKGLSAQHCTATSCASKGVALARHVGEELLSGFVYAILLKSAIHRHNLTPTYESNPVAIPIAGSRDSSRQIRRSRSCEGTWLRPKCSRLYFQRNCADRGS